jgi:DNA-binding PadR family transcriptional regulator
MYAEIVILGMLRQRPQHGYEIKKGIEQVFGGTVALNNTILYPTLKRFEEAGAVVRQVVQQDGKPNRHLYHLTERGIALLHASLCNFPPDLAANEAEFFTRVAYFEYLDPPEREAILKKRLAYLQGCLDYLRTMQQMADKEDCAPGTGTSMSNAQRVLAFHLQRVRHEYQWVLTWLEEMQANTSSS